MLTPPLTNFSNGLAVLGRSVLKSLAGCILLLAVTTLGFGTSASAREFNIVYSFCVQADCADGSHPLAGLARDGSGNLYGTTKEGGKTGGGSIFELSLDPKTGLWAEKVLYSFCSRPNCSDSFIPDSPLIIDTAGNLYGMTLAGQNREFPGIVFRLSPSPDRSHWKLTVLHRFCRKYNCEDGTFTLSGLSYAGAETGAFYDGKSPLYGTTVLGGEYLSEGLVFELTPSPRRKWHYGIIYDFCTSEPCYDGGPYSAPLVGADGSLYGTTNNGGKGSGGVAYQLRRKPRGHLWDEQVLYDFCSQPGCTDGYPPSGLIDDGFGDFFGTTAIGGSSCGDANHCGTIFKLDAAGKETVLYNFCSEMDCTDGYFPLSAPVVDSTGTLYGTTYRGGGNDIDEQGLGGGIVFAFKRSLQVLHRFCSEANCADGEHPEGELILDGAGHLYGVTNAGGAHGAGEVSEITP